jgi:hypothetical protein
MLVDGHEIHVRIPRPQAGERNVPRIGGVAAEPIAGDETLGVKGVEKVPIGLEFGQHAPVRHVEVGGEEVGHGQSVPTHHMCVQAADQITLKNHKMGDEGAVKPRERPQGLIE